MPPALHKPDTLAHDRAPTAALDFLGVRLGSVFQPIFSLVHQRAVGFEALLRGTDRNGAVVDPKAVFGQAESSDEIRQLDLLCHAVHLGNARQICSGHEWLFLNVHPRAMRAASYFSDLDAHVLAAGFTPRELVLEVLESADIDAAQLEEAIATLRALGFLIALDDFGAGHSNIDRIVRLTPDIVKLDRILVQRASEDKAVQRILPTLVRLLHEAGTLVLVEGMETRLQALIALDSGADMVQGFYFHRPFCTLSNLSRSVQSIHGLHDALSDARATQNNATARRLAPCMAALQRMAARWADTTDTQFTCAEALALDNVTRCYVLDGDGWQIGPSVPAAITGKALRFDPLADTSGARWANRQYFSDALAHFGQPVASLPYLSITDAYMCVTVSLAIDCRGETLVLCLDVLWD